MLILTITWELSDEESLLLDQVLATNFAEAVQNYAVLLARSREDPKLPVPLDPIRETREAFITRIGLKGIRGTLQTLAESLQKQNLAIVTKRYHDPSVSVLQRAAALAPLGLTLDGLQIVEKP